jgi:hypothetical protein
VSESEWKRCTRGNAIESKADIGMADAAAGNLNYYFVGPRLESGKFVSLQPLSRSDEPIAVSA